MNKVFYLLVLCLFSGCIKNQEQEKDLKDARDKLMQANNVIAQKDQEIFSQQDTITRLRNQLDSQRKEFNIKLNEGWTLARESEKQATELTVQVNSLQNELQQIQDRLLEELSKYDDLPFRKWVSNDGKSTCNARLKAINNLIATLEKDDGSLVDVSIHHFSDADQLYIKQWTAPFPTEKVCERCRGLHFIDCLKCQNGTTRGYRPDVIGTNPVTGDSLIKQVPIRIPCTFCNGVGKFNCPECNAN